MGTKRRLKKEGSSEPMSNLNKCEIDSNAKHSQRCVERET